MMRKLLRLNVLFALVLLPPLNVGPLQTSEDPEPFTLKTITTGFNNPIGIDHHVPSNKVVMSVNYPNGQPYNFELVASDGSRMQFSAINGLTDELKLATVRQSRCQGGFTSGELFTGNGTDGVVVRISADGSSIQDPWVNIGAGTGLMRGSLFQDRYCAFGGDLIVATTSGDVFRITSTGSATRVVDLDTHLEGLTTVPDNPAKYGPWAGKILAGAEGQGCLYSIDAAGAATCWRLGINPEDIDLIPDNENFYGVDFGGKKLWGAEAAQFTNMIGDILVAQEFPGILYRVRWDADSDTFKVEQLGQQVTQWEHVTFSPAGIVEILPPATVPPITIPSITVHSTTTSSTTVPPTTASPTTTAPQSPPVDSSPTLPRTGRNLLGWFVPATVLIGLGALLTHIGKRRFIRR